MPHLILRYYLEILVSLVLLGLSQNTVEFLGIRSLRHLPEFSSSWSYNVLRRVKTVCKYLSIIISEKDIVILVGVVIVTKFALRKTIEKLWSLLLISLFDGDASRGLEAAKNCTG